MADSQSNAVRTTDSATRCEDNFADGEILVASLFGMNISVLEMLRQYYINTDI
jgi:hypothetical protein